MKKYLSLILLCTTYLTAQTSVITKTHLKSLVLPGWGERTLGESKRSQIFFISEVALWLVYIGGKKTANWYQNDYSAFAELHSGVDMGGKNYLFAVNLGHYDSFDHFNDTKERQREVEDKYEEGKGFEWQWDNYENRKEYDKMRIKSVINDKYAKFAIGGLILNRLISFIDIIYLERTSLQINIAPQVDQDWNSVKLNLSLKL